MHIYIAISILFHIVSFGSSLSYTWMQNIILNIIYYID